MNTNVVDVAGRTFALVEAGSYRVELSDTLEEQIYNPFDGLLSGSFTAHPHRNSLTGEQHAICYEGWRPEEIRHVVSDAGGTVVREEPIAVKHGPSIHDCALTERYIVILDLPVTFSMKAVIGGNGFPYRWNPDHQARVGLLPRQGTAADIIWCDVWCDVDPAYVFHVANAHDRPDGRVVLDVCAYDTMFDVTPKGPNARSRRLERWTIDPGAQRVTIDTLDPRPQEFPRPDEPRFGQPYRYVFSLALPDKDSGEFVEASALYWHDLEEGETRVHDFGPGRRTGEFVFSPRSPNSPEGDGWLIGLVVDIVGETTDLVILDAIDFEGPAVAQIHLPHRVPPGFHRNWIASNGKAS